MNSSANLSLGVLWLFVVCVSCNNPVVELANYGNIEGLEVTTESGEIFDTFRGVPYAKAPVGELRFEKPQNAEAWSGVLEAKQFGAPCWPAPGMSAFLQYPIGFSEDCLTLNVFRQKQDSNEPEGYPVMVWIHGGGFTVGSSIEYGLENILDSYVSKGVVFVSINYRLNVMGFFSLEDPKSLGNYGLWDQSLALKWIHENIVAFGGDPKRVTIFGESAGAASVAIQSIVGHSKDYVQGAIAMSGAPDCPWALRSKGTIKEASQRIAKLVGCDHDSVERVMECIKKMPIKTFNEAEKQDSYFTLPLDGLTKFAPTFDGEYFDKPIDELIKESPKIPMIIGVTEQEGGLFATPPLPMPPALLSVDPTKTFTLDTFFERSITTVNTVLRYEDQDVEKLKSLIQFKYLDAYLGTEPTEDELLQAYSQLVGDIMFNADIIDFALQKRQAGSTVYYYEFDYYSSLSFPPKHKNKGSYHGFDLPVTFNKSVFYPMPFTADDRKMVEIMTKLFTNFAKSGNPTPGDVELKWLPQTDKHPLQYMTIATECEMKNPLDGRVSTFWRKLVPEMTTIGEKSPTPPVKRTKSEL